MRERAELTEGELLSRVLVKVRLSEPPGQFKLRINIRTAVPLNSLRYNPLFPEKLPDLSSSLTNEAPKSSPFPNHILGPGPLHLLASGSVNKVATGFSRPIQNDYY
jgi:hypothetical protein